MKKTEKLPQQNIRKIGTFQVKKTVFGTPSTDPTTSVVFTTSHPGQ